MKRFAEMWGPSTGWNGTDFSGPVKLIPRCGDRAVVILDARTSEDTQRFHAAEHARRHGYPAFRIMAGERFTDGRPVTKVLPATKAGLPHPVSVDHLEGRA